MRLLRLSLPGKLALAIALLVLFPAGLFAVHFYSQSRTAAIAQEMQRIQSYSRDVANEIDTFIFGQRDIARYSVFSKELKAFFGKDSKNPAVTAEFNEWLHRWSSVSRHIAEAFILDLQGNCIASTDSGFIGKNYSMRPYYKDAVRGLHHVSDWTIGVTSRKAGIYLSSPIVLDESRLIGIMVIKLDPEPIDAIIRRSQAIGIQVFLGNRDGVLLAHYDPLSRYATIDDLTPEAMDRIRETRQFADVHQVSLKLPTLFEDLSAAQPGETSTTREYRFRGQLKIAALTGTLSRNWVVGVTVPYDSIEAPVKRQLYSLIPLVVLLLLFATAAVYYLIRHVVRPLQELLDKSRLLSDGDYTVQVHTRGDDEVAQLAHTFNGMARQIRIHTEELEAKVAQRTVDLENAYREIKQLSITDALTGCFNRHYMNEHLKEEIDRARRYGRELSVIMCDVDHFKRVNDTWGHPAGDQVLVAVSAQLRQLRQGSDWVARLGGEEFLLVLPETAFDPARAIAEKLRQGIERIDIPWDSATVRVTASFGLASFRGDATDTTEKMIARADALLYRAKHEGRNRVITEDS